MEFYPIIQYNLIGTVKPKFTSRNKIWWRISDIEDPYKNVRETQERTSLTRVLHIKRYQTFDLDLQT